MSWLLSSIVGSGKPTLSFNVGEAYSDAWGAWVHCRGTSKVRCFRPAVRGAVTHVPHGAGLSARGRVRVQDHGRERKRP